MFIDGNHVSPWKYIIKKMFNIQGHENQVEKTRITKKKQSIHYESEQ